MLTKILKVATVVALAISGITVYHCAGSFTLKQYCSEGVLGQTYTQVNSSVLNKNLYLHQEINEHTSQAVIHNHPSPYFRMACSVELEAGLVKASIYGAGD